jgi:hypothetical protein
MTVIHFPDRAAGTLIDRADVHRRLETELPAARPSVDLPKYGHAMKAIFIICGAFLLFAADISYNDGDGLRDLAAFIKMI